MSQLYLANARVLDVEAGLIGDPAGVVIEDGRIREVGAARAPGDTPSIDLGGRTLMPGLIDAHVHVMISEMDLNRLRAMPTSLMAIRAGWIMGGMLDRGFTTVRDTGGADFGLKQGQQAGLIRGPRLFTCGRVISQTGGHDDFRMPTEDGPEECRCCSALDMCSRIVDGVPQVLNAVREELRRGADHIKLSVSGGVASPSDPLDSLQFIPEEITAAVQAATDWGVYVAAHAYSAAAITRALQCGVRTIEHGNMIDAAAAKLAAAKDAFVVPTLVTYECNARMGPALGFPAVSLEKNQKVLDVGLSSLEVCQAAGTQIGFGTDLLGDAHVHQGREFLIRAEAMAPIDVIRSATTVNARLLRREGELGVIQEGAIADLIAVDGDPLADIGVLADEGRSIPLVVQDGKVVKTAL